MYLIIGYGMSGKGVAHFLKEQAQPFCVFDDKLKEETTSFYHTYTPQFLNEKEITTVIKSPGVPYHHEAVQGALRQNIPVITDIEFYAQHLNNPIIGITGTNGKTTTTTLVDEMLTYANISHVTGGNIGRSLGEDITTLKENEKVLLELSSFQLKGTKTFRPQIGCLLNLSPTHLDFHGNFGDYANSKMNLFQNQREEDVAILPYALKHFKEQYNLKGTVYFVDVEPFSENGIFIEKDYVVFKKENRKLLLFSVKPFIGKIHVTNLLAATLIAYLSGVSGKDIEQTLQNFHGIEHRLEHVETALRRTFYNDSKATNVESTLSAVKTIGKPLVLIVGGKDRGADFTPLRPFFENGQIKRILAYGETKHLFEKLAKETYTPVVLCENVRECVQKSVELSTEEDTILFSPACASWDMHASFEERGKEFKDEIQQITTKKASFAL